MYTTGNCWQKARGSEMEKFEKDYTIRYNTRDRKTKKEAYDNVFTVTAYTEINAINKLLNMLDKQFSFAYNQNQ